MLTKEPHASDHAPTHVNPHFAAYWDLATGLLAIAALLTVRIRPLFWSFVAFNLVGMVDLILDYYHAIQIGLPAIAGQLGAAYVIPVIYVPALMITHIAAFYFLLRPKPETARTFAGETIASEMRMMGTS